MLHRWLAAFSIIAPCPLVAQTWNDAATERLVARAIERRAAADADSSLKSYRAHARGVVTFRAELGAEPGLTRWIVKADELQVEVYWRRPEGSKQIIRAWRDSTFFPNDLGYHRDHLGIASDDVGATIRIGEGDEVSDVVHPLAPDGPHLYDFAARDTITIEGPTGRLTLVGLDVRPKDRTQPRVVGTLFLDSDRAVVVRSQLTFTPAAYRDPDLEDITVRLDRALIDGRYWLPVAQEIEIRRRTRLFDFPLRGVIRGRWWIEDHEINVAMPAQFAIAQAIGGLRRPTIDTLAHWPAPLSTMIDSGLARAGGEALERVRSQALAIAKTRALDGLPRLRLAGLALSDFARVNRVQGLALGAGLSLRAAPFDRLRLTLGVGTSDGRVTGSVAAERRIGRWTLAAEGAREIADVGDVAGASGVVNSLAAQEGGRDLGDYVLLERAGLSAALGVGERSRFSVRVGREWASSVATETTPIHGRFRPNAPFGSAPVWVGRVAMQTGGGITEAAGPRRQAILAAEVGAGNGVGDYGRIVAMGEAGWRAASGLAGLRALVGVATPAVPARRSFALGGPGTLLGQPFRSLGGRTAAWISLEWLHSAPGPPLGTSGLRATPPEAWIGPVIALGWAGNSVSGAPWRPSRGVRPSVGLAAELFSRAVRIEVARAIGSPGGFGLAIDLTRAWWGIL